MSVFNSISNALVVLMVILMIAGGVLGMAVSDTDLFNPWTSKANASRIEVDTTHQQNLYIEEERRVQADNDFYIEQMQVELEKEKALADVEVESLKNQNKILESLRISIISAVSTFLNYLGILSPICLLIISIGYSMKTASQGARAKLIADKSTFSEKWKDPNYKKMKIEEAKRYEYLYNRIKQKPVTWQDLLRSQDE